MYNAYRLPFGAEFPCNVEHEISQRCTDLVCPISYEAYLDGLNGTWAPFQGPSAKVSWTSRWPKRMQFAQLSLIPAVSCLLTLEPYFERNCPGKILQPPRVSAFRGELECGLERLSLNELMVNQP